MTWSATQGGYLTGMESIQTLDLLAIEMERRYGNDRLRLLVSEELRTKFDQQRRNTDAAITRGELEDVIRETKRMQAAWRALDKVASADPTNFLPATVWETPGPDGSVVQIVRESEKAGLQAALNVQQGRKAVVYTLEEIGRLVASFPTLYSTKTVFEGATITAVRQSVTDPLNGGPQ